MLIFEYLNKDLSLDIFEYFIYGYIKYAWIGYNINTWVYILHMSSSCEKI